MRLYVVSSQVIKTQMRIAKESQARPCSEKTGPLGSSVSWFLSYACLGSEYPGKKKGQQKTAGPFVFRLKPVERLVGPDV